jgi:hypothetical protein
MASRQRPGQRLSSGGDGLAYQGISFFMPFFFLLLDSELVSTGVGFAGVEALSAD